VHPEESEKTKEEKKAAKLAKIKCFNCGGKGHPARNCPHKEKKEGEPLAGMMLDACCTSSNGKLHKCHEICIDNGS
jgi:Na+-translocating ferredoxin:NAD+ oxidoreductase RNF subunit RnfB